ncbi:tripartite tricarboxylate transporter substrate binding protein [Blastococcus sp. MG754426]|uniref:tripartite tricarboxylate transporter substrate binding protein n=1 Tax=unclassified Blastococcus TaxID=2619396 RepID=UPI001EEFB76A|nr:MULTISPECIES: tripartite tricarboxylate transporter substrate binding protein [unclassified Blastococcus]MCF6508475.1 tripartite tricarboxylate transporter substrate binding protein [Blastococcus sp. MG754426]MCF6513118.1 tripartite tricarboxylate transporter substrate binding protein [Blastococcus sp. MG754427]
MRISAGLASVALIGLVAACGGDDSGGGTAAEGGGGGEASSYPTESIRMLVPYGAGGPTDLTTRTVGACLEEELGQTVVVENLPGGSGALATTELVGAEPDGYTLSLVTAGTMVLTPLANEVGYTKDDITPVGVMTEVPSVLAVGENSPYASAEDFFAAVEAQPGTITVGTPGASTPQAIELQRLAEEHGVQVTAVPFNGNAEMTTALLGGNVDAVLINASSDVVQNIESGAFVPLVASPEERLSWLPDTPTFEELGYDGLTLSGSTFGLAGPAGLPDDVVSTLEETLQTCLEKPEVQEQLGEEYVLEEFAGADELAEVLDRTQEVYEPILG